MANNVYMDLSNCDNTSENDRFIFNNISTSVQNCEYFKDSELISLYTNLKQNSTFSTLAVKLTASVKLVLIHAAYEKTLKNWNCA